MPETDAEQRSHQLAAKLRSWISTDPLMRRREERHIQLRSRDIPRKRIHSAGIDSGGGLLDVPLQAPGLATRFPPPDHFDPDDAKQWKRDVLDAYLGVTLKRLFATGPDAFVEIYSRIEQFARSLRKRKGSTSVQQGERRREIIQRHIL